MTGANGRTQKNPKVISFVQGRSVTSVVGNMRLPDGLRTQSNLRLCCKISVYSSSQNAAMHSRTIRMIRPIGPPMSGYVPPSVSSKRGDHQVDSEASTSAIASPLI